MPSRVMGLVIWLAAVQSAVAQVPLPDPTPRRAALAGTVRDTLGRPLALVTITADGTDLSTVTDSTGRFHLSGLRAGRGSYTVMRIGFKALSFETTLPPDSTILIDIRMRSAQTLPEVNVAAERRSVRLVRTGFYERHQKGMGKYLSPDEVEKLSHHVGSPAQLLRNVSGVTVRCGRNNRCVVLGGGSRCMALFIDGVYWRGQLDENLSVAAVYAVEVYNRGAIVPIDFAHPATQACGAIIVWTQSKRPDR